MPTVTRGTSDPVLVEAPDVGTLDYETPRRPSLTRRTLSGGAWTVGGYVLLNVVRLGTNLVLVRLLAPDVFGIVAWLSAVLVGLQMFSDVGIGPAIIQNPRGEDDRFLRTAYTIQVLRGWMIFGVACALAWPLAKLYGIGAFTYLIPVAALTAVLDGFRSTAFHRLNRHMRIRELTLLDFGRMLLQSVLMIVMARLWPNVWALLIPMLVAVAAEMTVTHFIMRDRHDGFGWDRPSARMLFSFGKWVFLSTLLTFLANSSDKFIFPGIFSFVELGVYSIALGLATLPTQAILSVGHKVIFPAYSEVARALQRRQEAQRGDLSALDAAAAVEPGEESGSYIEWEQGADRFRRVFGRVRRVLLVLGALAVAGLVATGPWLIGLLYPANYQAAGWMLQLLAAGAWFQVLEVTNGSAMLAMGQPKWVALSMAGKVVAMAILIPLLAWQWGFSGAVAAVAGAEVIRYAGSLVGLSRLGLGLRVLGWDIFLTACVAASAGAGYLAGLAFEGNLMRLLVSGVVTTALWSPVIWVSWSRWRRWRGEAAG